VGKPVILVPIQESLVITVEPAALKLSSASSARREGTLQNRRKP
jgi:hypothetical protein